MIDHKKIATEFFVQLKVKTINAYAKSHEIKIGKNKRATIANILDRCDTFKVELLALPGDDIEFCMVFIPSDE